MSVITVHQLCCDSAGCTEAYRAAAFDIYSIGRQRASAKAEGWRHDRTRGKDYCPKHSGRPATGKEPTDG